MEKLSLREVVARPLRGQYNSVRYRFLTLPRQRARLFWYGLVGRSWIDYYRDYMDGNVQGAQAINLPVKDEYINAAADHLSVLKELGLKQGDRVLDIGCGILRTALFLIPYIGPNYYVGTDISAGRIERGRKLVLEPRGIRADSYEVVVVADNSLREFVGKRSFQYIWANSVLTHMPLEDIRELLAASIQVLAKNGQSVLTYSTASAVQRKKIKDFYYPEELIRAECEAVGYKYDSLDHFRGLSEFEDKDSKLVRLTRRI